MKRKTARANNSFLLGSLILIVLVLVTVVLFLFYAMKIYEKNDPHYTERYDISLGKSTFNSPITLYLNDSILFSGTPKSSLTLSVGRFAEESTLLIVDDESDYVTTIKLPEQSDKILIEKEGTGFFRHE